MAVQRQRLTELPFNRMIPNILTLLALCAGITAVRYGLDERWEEAIIAILVAAILDGLDGRIARILKGASKFGAELDSLSDFICFGVAPAMLLYLWVLHGASRFAWVLVLLFSVCSALRLARFNTAIDDSEKPGWMGNFFTGVPAPAGAGLVLLPMILWFQLGDGVFNHPVTVSLFLLVVSGLLISRVPTFSFKKFKVPQSFVLPTMLGVGLLAALIVTATWLTLSVIMILYVATFPFSIRTHRRLQRADEARREAASGAQTPEPQPEP